MNPDTLKQILIGLLHDYVAKAGDRVLPVVADALEEAQDQRAESIRRWLSDEATPQDHPILVLAQEYQQARDLWMREQEQEHFKQRTEVGIDSYVVPDGWSNRHGGFGSRLIEDDTGLAAFRLPSSCYPDLAYPVNVTVTGRSIRRRQGGLMVRVRIEWVHDGEPSTFDRGWMGVL